MYEVLLLYKNTFWNKNVAQLFYQGVDVTPTQTKVTGIARATYSSNRQTKK